MEHKHHSRRCSTAKPDLGGVVDYVKYKLGFLRVVNQPKQHETIEIPNESTRLHHRLFELIRRENVDGFKEACTSLRGDVDENFIFHFHVFNSCQCVMGFSESLFLGMYVNIFTRDKRCACMETSNTPLTAYQLGVNLVHMAAAVQNPFFIRYLHENGFSLAKPTSVFGLLPVHISAFNCSPAVLNYLLEHTPYNHLFRETLTCDTLVTLFRSSLSRLQVLGFYSRLGVPVWEERWLKCLLLLESKHQPWQTREWGELYVAAKQKAWSVLKTLLATKKHRKFLTRWIALAFHETISHASCPSELKSQFIKKAEELDVILYVADPSVKGGKIKISCASADEGFKAEHKADDTIVTRPEAANKEGEQDSTQKDMFRGMSFVHEENDYVDPRYSTRL